MERSNSPAVRSPKWSTVDAGSPMPLAIPNKSRTRNSRVNASDGARKSGQTSRTGWSQANAPSSTCVATSNELIDLVVEPTRKCVSGVTGAPLVRSRTPYVLRWSIPSAVTIAIAAPTNPKVCMPSRTAASKAAQSMSGVGVWARATAFDRSPKPPVTNEERRRRRNQGASGKTAGHSEMASNAP